MKTWFSRGVVIRSQPFVLGRRNKVNDERTCDLGLLHGMRSALPTRTTGWSPARVTTCLNRPTTIADLFAYPHWRGSHIGTRQPGCTMETDIALCRRLRQLLCHPSWPTPQIWKRHRQCSRETSTTTRTKRCLSISRLDLLPQLKWTRSRIACTAISKKFCMSSKDFIRGTFR